MKKERSLTAFNPLKQKTTVFVSALVLFFSPWNSVASGSASDQKEITASSCELYVSGLDMKHSTDANIFINFEDPAEEVEVQLKDVAYKKLRLVAYFQNNFKGAVEEFHLFSLLGSSPMETYIGHKFSVPENAGACRSISFPIDFSSPELVLTFNILKPNDFDPKSIEFLKTKKIKLTL